MITLNDSQYIALGSPATEEMKYGVILNSLGDQITDRFLFIGIISLVFAVWFYLDMDKRQDQASQIMTGALKGLALISGLTALVFYAAAKGMIDI